MQGWPLAFVFPGQGSLDTKAVETSQRMAPGLFAAAAELADAAVPRWRSAVVAALAGSSEQFGRVELKIYAASLAASERLTERGWHDADPTISSAAGGVDRLAIVVDIEEDSLGCARLILFGVDQRIAGGFEQFGFHAMALKHGADEFGVAADVGAVGPDIGDGEQFCEFRHDLRLVRGGEALNGGPILGASECGGTEEQRDSHTVTIAKSGSPARRRAGHGPAALL